MLRNLGSRIGLILLVISLLVGAVPICKAAKSENTEFSINDVLKAASFAPHVPPEEVLISRYGAGQVIEEKGDRYHIYYLPRSKMWIRCKIDGDDTVYKPVYEILVSTLPLGGKVLPTSAVATPELKGIHIGDNLERISRKFGTPFRVFSTRLGSQSAKAFEFFPNSPDEGSCVRFFIKRNTVIGFSLSLEG
jgi:hypothetical protein